MSKFRIRPRRTVFGTYLGCFEIVVYGIVVDWVCPTIADAFRAIDCYVATQGRYEAFLLLIRSPTIDDERRRWHALARLAKAGRPDRHAHKLHLARAH